MRGGVVAVVLVAALAVGGGAARTRRQSAKRSDVLGGVKTVSRDNSEILEERERLEEELRAPPPEAMGSDAERQAIMMEFVTRHPEHAPTLKKLQQGQLRPEDPEVLGMLADLEALEAEFYARGPGAGTDEKLAQQQAFLMEFLMRHPEHEAALRRFQADEAGPDDPAILAMFRDLEAMEIEYMGQ